VWNDVYNAEGSRRSLQAFFGAFPTTAKSDYKLQSVRLHSTTRLPLEGFS
jgi:hypothetical protein